MLFLALSILLSTYLVLAFKALEKMGLNLFHSIVFNYWACVLTGAFMQGGLHVSSHSFSEAWFKWACLMGCMFLSLFYVIGLTAQKINVSVTSVSNKLSLVIPVVFGMLLYNESISLLQGIGIGLAMMAVVFTCWPNKQTEANNKKKHFLLFLLPFY
jgi:drug/metabolite transporter (DMT)-like permease